MLIHCSSVLLFYLAGVKYKTIRLVQSGGYILFNLLGTSNTVLIIVIILYRYHIILFILVIRVKIIH